MADIPDVINISLSLHDLIQAMASVVAIAVGGFFAFLIVKKAIRWSHTAMGSNSIEGEDRDYRDYIHDPASEDGGYHTNHRIRNGVHYAQLSDGMWVRAKMDNTYYENEYWRDV